MNVTSKYPIQNVFNSEPWRNRVRALGLDRGSFSKGNLKGLNVAFLRSGTWADFEEWPTAESIEAGRRESAATDWIVYRKLLGEQMTQQRVDELISSFPIHKRPLVLPYGVSPYIDLRSPKAGKKSPMAHLGRTERKLTREIGAPVLREYKTADERKSWFQNYALFQRAQDRLSDEQYEILKAWTTEGEKPDWMLLLSFDVGSTVLATGLFYFFDGVFYYFGSAMNPDPAFRKYGPGKLFVSRLIALATERDGRIFDFLQGGHAYKGHWNPECRTIYQCIVPQTLKGALALGIFRAKKALIPSRNDLELHSDAEPS